MFPLSHCKCFKNVKCCKIIIQVIALFILITVESFYVICVITDLILACPDLLQIPPKNKIFYGWAF